MRILRTLFAAGLARDVRLYVFEPLPPTFAVLARNLRLHGIDARLFNVGVAARSGRETFTFYPHCSVISGRLPDPQEEHELQELQELSPESPPLSNQLLSEPVSVVSSTSLEIGDKSREELQEELPYIALDLAKDIRPKAA